MDILSRDMLELLRDEKFREAMEEVLKQTNTETKTVTVGSDRSERSDSDKSQSKTVRIRRVA